MTVAKQVPESIKTLLEDSVVKNILDRGSNIQPAIDTVSSWWGFDLFARKPSPAYIEDGVFHTTDLDLACFLWTLAERHAVINIPTYKAHTKEKKKVGEELKSAYNRNGQVLGIGANKEFLSFNISIRDLNVVGQDYHGAPRTFSLTNYEGNWYDGWQTIEFQPTLKENSWINESKLWTGNRIYFKHFIHPNRWTSLFGQYYVKTKMLISRLEDEASYLYSQIKELKEAGITFPDGEGPKKDEYEYGEGVSKKFKAYEFMIYIPETEITGTYRKPEKTQEELILMHNRRSYLLYNVIPKLRFMTRATEYAHIKQPDALPAWFKGVNWEQNFVIPGKRAKWNRYKLFQPAVGVNSISILKREYEKSATVKAD
jgi:hypothetical protein